VSLVDFSAKEAFTATVLEVL